MNTRRLLLLAALPLMACAKPATPCDNLKAAYIQRAEQMFAEALAQSDEIRDELAIEIKSEYAAIERNFPIACQALPKDFDQSCLLSRDREGCELYGEAFDDALFASPNLPY